MKIRSCALFASLLCLFWLNFSTAGEILIFTPPGIINLPEGKSLCKLNEATTPAEIQGVLSNYNAEQIKKAFAEYDTIQFPIDVDNIFLVTLPEGQDMEDAVADLNALDTLSHWLIHAEPNFIEVENGQTNDPYINDQWGLSNYPKGIKAFNAWNISKGASWVKIGIIDHGADINHPDLYGRITGDMPVSSPHGTEVAGVVGAMTNNNRGIAGVDWYSSLYSYSTEPRGEVPTYVAMIRAVNAGMHIVNISLGYSDVTTDNMWLIRSATAYAYNHGVLIVAALGNDNVNEVSAPAALWYWAVLAVGAGDFNGHVWQYSNYGQCLDLLAPGGTSIYGGSIYDIVTTSIIFPTDTIPGDDTLPPVEGSSSPSDWQQTYKFVTGCSFAAPHVAGSASLLKAYRPELTNDDLDNILKLSATNMLTPGWDDHSGYGRVNADSALKMMGGPYAFIQNQTTTAPYETWCSDPIKVYLYGIENFENGIWIGKIHEVRQRVYFPHAFMEPPKIWIRGAYTDGWYPENFQFGIKYGWVSEITTEWAELVTYVFEVRGSEEGPTYYLPKSISDVRISYSALGRWALYTPSPSAQVVRLRYQNKINIAWLDNNFCEQGYKIQMRDSLGGWHDLATVPENNHEFTDSTLAGSEQTAYRVKAFNQWWESDWSQPIEVKNAPNSPTNLQAGVYLRPRRLGKIVPLGPLGKPAPPPPQDLVRTNQINLIWEPPTNQNSPITFYRVKYAWFQECTNPPWCDTYPIHYTPPICNLYYSLYPLPYNNQVYFDVYAFDQSGDSSAFLSGYLTTGNYDAHPDTMPDDMLDKLVAVPNDFILLQNYPNPFNPVTTIDYGLSTNSYVKLTIYNILGQRVKTLVDEEQTAGYKTVMWDGRNDRGEQVSSGIYLYRIQAGSFTKTVKMSLLK